MCSNIWPHGTPVSVFFADFFHKHNHLWEPQTHPYNIGVSVWICLFVSMLASPNSSKEYVSLSHIYFSQEESVSVINDSHGRSFISYASDRTHMVFLIYILLHTHVPFPSSQAQAGQFTAAVRPKGRARSTNSLENSGDSGGCWGKGGMGGHEKSKSLKHVNIYKKHSPVKWDWCFPRYIVEIDCRDTSYVYMYLSKEV